MRMLRGQEQRNPMKHTGKCNCGNCEVVVETPLELGRLAPRICDCDFCQTYSSAMVSDIELDITLLIKKAGLNISTNGSGQASFYHCRCCDQLLAVGATISGDSRGAVNADLFKNRNQFAPPAAIQPKFLSPLERVERWTKIWGSLVVRHA